MCGEHLMQCPSVVVPHGSSPRVWGAFECGKRDIEHAGIIPTCVGSMITTRIWSAVATDHPHVCGEHHRTARRGLQWPGSSPRVWGASDAMPIGGGTPWIIPTCVGSMPPDESGRLFHADHPHVCGEHTSTVAPPPLKQGSSPRVWGASCRRLRPIGLVRIIPTCVGSMLALFSS